MVFRRANRRKELKPLEAPGKPHTRSGLEGLEDLGEEGEAILAMLAEQEEALARIQAERAAIQG